MVGCIRAKKLNEKPLHSKKSEQTYIPSKRQRVLKLPNFSSSGQDNLISFNSHDSNILSYEQQYILLKEIEEAHLNLVNCISKFTLRREKIYVDAFNNKIATELREQFGSKSKPKLDPRSTILLSDLIALEKDTSDEGIRKLFEFIYYKIWEHKDGYNHSHILIKSARLILREIADLFLEEDKSKYISKSELNTYLKYKKEIKEGLNIINVNMGQLITHNISFIIKQTTSLIKTKVGRPNQLDDLIEEGIIAMLYSIDRFDLRKGHGLLTFVGRAMHLRMFRHLGYSKFKTYYRYYKTREKLNREYGRNPTNEEIAEEAVMNLKLVKQYSMSNVLSFNNPIYLSQLDDNDDTFVSYQIRDHNPLNPEEECERRELLDIVLDTLNSPSISERDRKIFLSRYNLSEAGKPMSTKRKTLVELAKDYKISPERVRQIEREILNKVRRKLSHYLNI